MPETSGDGKDTARKPESVTVSIDDKTHVLTSDRAFAFGHTLLRGRHYKQAMAIFEALGQARPDDQRIKVMLARCQAGLAHYEACREILESVFDESGQSPVEELQSAFVCRKLGMIDAAIRELSAVVRDYDDVPTACLSLGDMFAAVGLGEKAAACWKLAIKREAPEGSVAKAAALQLRQQAAQGQNAERPKDQADGSGA